MTVIAYTCDCWPSHDDDCSLLLRLRIKEVICRERGVLHYVPPEVAQAIDEEVARQASRRNA